jgi:hypothetical protein
MVLRRSPDYATDNYRAYLIDSAGHVVCRIDLDSENARAARIELPAAPSAEALLSGEARVRVIPAAKAGRFGS